MSKFIQMEETDDVFNGKPVFSITNRKSGDEIAQIFWYAPWRQWCARFMEDSVWSLGCLEDIHKYLGRVSHQFLMEGSEKKNG